MQCRPVKQRGIVGYGETAGQHCPRIGMSTNIEIAMFVGAGICHLSFSWVARPYDLLRANI